MKKLVMAIFIFGCCFNFLTADDDGHLPWCNGASWHSAAYHGPCYGYAMGKAYGYSWTNAICPIHAQNLGIEEIYGDYFELIDTDASEIDYTLVKVHDIVTWPNHAAYVCGKTGDSASQIFILQKYQSTTSSDAPVAISLDTENGSHVTNGPTNLYRRKAAWKIYLENKINGSNAIGDIKFKRSDDDGWTTVTSGTLVSDIHWNEDVYLDAIMADQVVGGYFQRFQHWSDGDGEIKTTKICAIKVPDDLSYDARWKATFYKEYNITFPSREPWKSMTPLLIFKTTCFMCCRVIQ